MGTLRVVVQLPCGAAGGFKCVFNRSTLLSSFASSPKCPLCGQAYPMPGPQPSGRMRAERIPVDCAGFAGRGSLLVTYTFDSGVQGEQHPKPGVRYHGTMRQAYLPDDEETGKPALALLRAAFEQGQLFRVGNSATTGKENVVVWSIHQKTQPSGGETRHGWPDPTYLQRLASECAAANVVAPTS